MAQQILRSVNKKSPLRGGRLWLPPRLVELIPPESRFEPELTEDGILFRRIIEKKVEISWINGGAEHFFGGHK